ncbi:MAG: hypothetical protein NTZ49_04800 [Candidatus Parcubacteria bacterium]|nr:hypothetical protein [Candidatus Parcubacteria bacterium]
MKMVRVIIMAYDSYRESERRGLSPEEHVGNRHFVGIRYFGKIDWHWLSRSINSTLKEYHLLTNEGECGNGGSPYWADLRDAWIEGNDLCLLWRKLGPSGVKRTKQGELDKHGRYGITRYNPPRYYYYEEEVSAYHNYIITISLSSFSWDCKFFCLSKTEDEALIGHHLKADKAMHFPLDKVPFSKNLRQSKDTEFAMGLGIIMPVTLKTPRYREYNMSEELFSNLVLFCQNKAQLTSI